MDVFIQTPNIQTKRLSQNYTARELYSICTATYNRNTKNNGQFFRQNLNIYVLFVEAHLYSLQLEGVKNDICSPGCKTVRLKISHFCPPQPEVRLGNVSTAPELQMKVNLKVILYLVGSAIQPI